MKCIIAGGNVKVLGRAVHSLSRIGDELYLEPTDGGSFLGIFRSLPSLEKTVEKCLILLRPRASRLVVQLHCKYGVTKTHNLAFQECERLQAVFDTQRCASQLCAPARVLAEAVVHFPPTLAEVTLGAGPGGKLSLRNYVEDETELKKTMVTELWLAEDEFQMVAVVPGSHITFCLKEFRVGMGTPSLLRQPCPWSPLSGPLCPPGRWFSPWMMQCWRSTWCWPPSQTQKATCSPPPTNGVSHPPAPSDDFADDLESYMIAMETSAYEEGSGAPPSPTFPLRTPHPAESDPEEEEEEEEGAVPGTPPHKKFCSLFFGSVLMPRGPSLAPTQEVLAEDSDNEY
ncbi:cell cycle checkpoint control protein RAD9A isoform X2 [Falco rusticolus]|uniref:cell cycle checkpoint control protein RAD9A isoform X2 n=1 Tax=Falco rusticolus TaxID=120794 RepID=UPI001886A17A|nr:cell cycle checkpoint control protein RAD9A isoform X2 [Falco rusticolus]